MAARLVQQASQPKSGLLLGDISGHCTCIEIVHAGAGNDVPEVAVGCGNLMGALRCAATTSPPSGGSSGVPQRKETHVLESIGAQAFLSIDDAYHSVEKMFDSSQLKDPSSDAIGALETNNAGFLLVLDLDFSTVGEEGSSERTDFQRRLQSDLAIASGWRGGEDSLEFADVTVVRQAAGIGLHFSVAKHPKGVPAPARVKSLAAGSVAESAGLKEGQMIYKIDGQDITMYPPDKTAALLRGAPGTQVVLTVTSPLPVAAASTDMTSQSRPRRPRGGLPPENFHVKTLSPGSVRADIQVCLLCVFINMVDAHVPCKYPDSYDRTCAVHFSPPPLVCRKPALRDCVAERTLLHYGAHSSSSASSELDELPFWCSTPVPLRDCFDHASSRGRQDHPTTLGRGRSG